VPETEPEAVDIETFPCYEAPSIIYPPLIATGSAFILPSDAWVTKKYESVSTSQIPESDNLTGRSIGEISPIGTEQPQSEAVSLAHF